MGVLEIEASLECLQQRRETLESIASQTAIVIRNLEERAREQRRREATADALELATDLMASASPPAAVERIATYLYRRTHKPTAGWLRDGAGSSYELIATRGLRGQARSDFWQTGSRMPPRSDLNRRVWRLQARPSVEGLGHGDVTWLDAVDAVFAIAGDAESVSELTPTLETMIPRVLQHLRLIETAERRSRGLDTALAWTAHEFRTPLISATATLQALQAQGSRNGQDRLLLQSSRELSELTELVEALLRWSVGRSRIRKRRMDLMKIVNDVVASIDDAERERVVVLGPPSVIVRADPLYLRSAVGNLVRNALMYSDPSTKVRVVLHRSPDEAHISVIDEGPGVPPEEVPTIFDPFIRGRVGQRSRKGRGLGLFVTQRVVDAHGGRIWTESVPQGGRFHILLPTEATGAHSSAS
ncbi:MAG: sensor histidine kinase [Actinomycetota bacterium]